MSKQSYSKYTTFFKHLQELSLLWTGKTFPCSIYWDAFWCPQRLPGQWPCAHYRVLPRTTPGLSLVSHKSRDRGQGQEKWPFSRTLGLPVGILPCWGFTLNFSIPAWAPLAHVSIFWRMPLSTVYFQTQKHHLIPLLNRSKEAAEIFLKLAHSPREPFIFPSLSWRCSSLFLEPQVSAWMGQRGYTNHVHSCRANPHIPPSSTCIQLEPLP